MTQPLRIAVAGHTNTGKTSLLRTLTRDTKFGQVSGRPGTTRHVEAARLLVKGRVLLELFDTPGLEEPIDLLALLDDQSAASGSRADGPARMQRFLESQPAVDRFEQEAKVIRQMLRSDAAFYVIDARDPVLAKHRDELEILRLCGVPLLPLLNFVSSADARENEWREALAGLGLHAIVRFDTVTPAQDGERVLYNKLASLLDQHSEILQVLIASHQADAQQRQDSALQLVAELLIDVAATCTRVNVIEQGALELGIGQLNDQVRRREQVCVERLLSLFRFYPDDLESADLPLPEGRWSEGRWQDDLFDPYTLQAMGIKVGGGAAAGAAAGVGIDLMVGGITLGAAAVTGALLGGGVQTLRHYGSGLLSRVTGEKLLRVDDSILLALATRQCQLIRALANRGHAAQHKLMPARLADTTAGIFNQNRLPAPLRQARANPDWVSADQLRLLDNGRQRAVKELVGILVAQIHSGEQDQTLDQ